jgi:pimeloyl-ACP methyl ester carboxylesterase
MLTAVVASAQSTRVDDTPLNIDHYVPVVSSAPSMDGQVAQIYVRERVTPATLARTASLENRVALFVHGAGTPAEVAFDVPHGGYSWMAHLADAGFDVFSMDTTGYGRSTRPLPMNDPCNLAGDQQADLVGTLLDEACPPSYPYAATTIESDWRDIDAVVDYLRDLRNVERVHMLAWSLGGPRAGGYAARHADKVDRLVLLAPAYNRGASATPPEEFPAGGAAMTKQSWEDFVANWDRQVGCPGQYEPEVARSVWTAMMESDPVGATWGPGVRRAPRTTVWGWTRESVGQGDTPMLLVAGVHDAQVSPDRVRELYDDLGVENRILIDLGCASHNAMWESNRTILFDASLEWLRRGTVNGLASGVLQMGY